MIWPIIIIAAVTLGSIWRPKLGAALIILVWPSYLLRLDIGSIPTTALELSLYAVTLITVIRSRHSGSEFWPKWPWRRWLILALWVAAWIVAASFANDGAAAWGATKAWMIDPLIFGWVLWKIGKSPADKALLLKAAIISGTMVAAAGLAQMLWWRGTVENGRLSSWFHPVANYAAMFIAPLLVANIGWLIYGARKWWYFVTAGVMVIALLLTMSYGGYLSLGVGLVVLWFYYPRGKTKNLMLWSAVVAVVLFMGGLSRTNNFAQHFTNPDRTSAAVRDQIWHATWEIIKQHPIVGVGPNNFEREYRLVLPKLYHPPLEWKVAKAHNLVLNLWAETGALGLIMFIAIVSGLTINLWRSSRNQSENRPSLIIGLAVLLALVVHGLVDTPYFKNDLALLFIWAIVWPWLGNKVGGDRKL